jgi:hypothetical protein
MPKFARSREPSTVHRTGSCGVNNSQPSPLSCQLIGILSTPCTEINESHQIITHG